MHTKGVHTIGKNLNTIFAAFSFIASSHPHSKSLSLKRKREHHIYVLCIENPDYITFENRTLFSKEKKTQKKII